MDMDTQDKIQLLTIHKNNLLKTKTFEEYRNAHVAYIDCLIGQLEGDKQWIMATETFVNKDK